jgi:alanine racemase
MDHTSWIEVDTGALARNLRALADHTSVPICAVVKSNAYGHGIVGASKAFVEAGAGMLGVTRIEEARALRAAGIDAPVLIMMPVIDIAEAIALDCDITIGSTEQVRDVPSEARVHLKVDTGNGRLGVAASDAFAVARDLQHRASLEAVWTHFADAAGSTGAKQLSQFDGVLASLRGAGITTAAHAANSSAALALPAARYDMIRAGTLLYGQNPVGAKAPYPLHDGFRWFARVVAVRTLAAGATVGYGSEYRADDEVRVATIAVGYTDGYSIEPLARTPSAREIARRAKNAMTPARRIVYFGDREAPVIGRVAMQAITCVVDGMPDVQIGSVARIPARRILVDPLIERVYV